MPALNASLQVVSLVEASGLPYIEKLAKVAVAVIELLEKKAKSKEDVKELCESITNTVDVIETLVSMHGERGAAYFKDICTEMERYLTGIADDLKDVQRKHRGIQGFLNINKFQDTIQGYRKRVDDLKADFLIHITGDSMLALIEIHHMLTEMRNVKKTALKEESVTIRAAQFLVQFAQLDLLAEAALLAAAGENAATPPALPPLMPRPSQASSNDMPFGLVNEPAYGFYHNEDAYAFDWSPDTTVHSTPFTSFQPPLHLSDIPTHHPAIYNYSPTPPRQSLAFGSSVNTVILPPAFKRPLSPSAFASPQVQGSSAKKIKAANKENHDLSDNEVQIVENRVIKTPARKSTAPVIKMEVKKEVKKETEGSNRWSDVDKDELFAYILGPESSGNRFKKFQVNPAAIYKEAKKALACGSRHNLAAMKGQFDRSLATYKQLYEFHNFTGGGGDADELDFDDEDQVKERMNHAKQAGRDLGTLNAKKVQLWQERGWYALFDGRYGKSPKVVREKIRNSATALSDPPQGNDSDGNSTDSEAELQTIEKVNTRTPKTSSTKVTGRASNSATVSEPKHTPASRFRAQSQDAMSGMSEYFRSKAELERKRIETVEARLEHDKAKDKVSLARQLLEQKDSDLDWAVREAANALLLKHLQG